MKNNIIKSILLFCVLFITINASSQDRTYYIVERYLSTKTGSKIEPVKGTINEFIGPLDLVIKDAVSFLDKQSYEGGIVLIKFKVPLEDPKDFNSGLVILDTDLPGINHNYGKIIFEGTNLRNNQGIYGNNSSGKNEFTFFHSGSDIEISNLHFIEGNYSANFFLSKGFGNINIRNNIFSAKYNVENAVNISANSKITIYNNEITGVKSAININISDVPKIIVSNNTIYDDNVQYGININSLKYFDLPYYSILIEENIISSDLIAIQLLNPSKGVSIKNNELNYKNKGIVCRSDQVLNDYEQELLSFVNLNDLNYDTVNTGNIFIYNGEKGNKNIAISYESEKHIVIKQAKLIGYNLPGSVGIDNVTNVIIRDCRIIASSDPLEPILFSNTANGDIKRPELIALTRYSDQITVDYKLPGLKPDMEKYIVDFYNTNENGDLLGLIYSDTIVKLSSDENYQSSFKYKDFNGLISFTVSLYGDSKPEISKGPGTSQNGTKSFFVSISSQGDGCLDVPMNIFISVPPVYPFLYNIDGGEYIPAESYELIVTHTFTTPGRHDICVSFDGIYSFYCSAVFVNDCSVIPIDCENCISTFSPEPGSKYLVSAWVKEDVAQTDSRYYNASIKIFYYNAIINHYDPNIPIIGSNELYPSGEIIEGWQKIEETITIPNYTESIIIQLHNNSNSVDAYFDDIRFHPFNSSMQSFVYDFSTGLLNAAHDENNYSTFYEYDEEGALIRIKKETERGIMTVQESRNINKKE